MSKRTLLLLCTLSLLCLSLFSRQASEPQTPGKRLIDIKAGVMYPIDIAADSTAICLTGDVVFYHNGAVITCDSAVRYSDKHMECFRNVIINKDSTYIYGDRADYNGDLNIATVYSPLIKIMDGDAVMYTYDFKFNTLDNIGQFSGGGVLYQGDNVMESERGYYYSSTRRVVCVDRVEIRNSDYRMKSDSLVYDMNDNTAEFFTRSYMWNNQNDMLSADCGTYDRASAICHFTSDAYVLSAYRELWADTLEYDNRINDTEARGNVQILESEQKSMAFGDFARYTGARGETILTRDPSILNFDKKQNAGDTLFMRADTIYMFVIYPSDSMDSLRSEAEKAVDRFAHLKWLDTLDSVRRIFLADSIRTEYQAMQHISDSLSAAADSSIAEIIARLMPAAKKDSVHSDSVPGPGIIPPDSISRDSIQQDNASADEIADRLPVQEEHDTVRSDSAAKPAILPADSISGEPIRPDSSMSTTIQTDSTAEKITAVEPSAPDIDSLIPPQVRQWRLQAESLKRTADSLQTVEQYLRPLLPVIQAPEIKADSVAAADTLRSDTTKVLSAKQLKRMEKQRRKEKKLEEKRLKRQLREEKRKERLARRGIEYGLPQKADSTLADSIPPILSDSLLNVAAQEPDVEAVDTITRIIRGWHNVRMYRKDMQAVADSMVVLSADSTLHLYIEPVIWSGENQITSETVDMFTTGQALDRAEFIGNPIMSSKLDSVHYNQVAGKTMLARFRDGELVRNDVNGNAQAIYYLQEDDDPALLALLVITCSNMTFEFEDQFVSYITPRVSLEWHMYPMDKIPADQPLTLSWFKWEAQRRPSRQDVFSRTLVRDSQREQYENIGKPKFSISKKIDSRRKRLIENGIWADRTDPLPAHAIDYIRTISVSE